MQNILDFAKMNVPEDWRERSIEDRRAYWQNPDDAPAEPRRTICAVEVWCELFGEERKSLTQVETRKINCILARLPSYRLSGSANCGPYGRQRAFVRLGLPKRWTRIAAMRK